MPRYIAHDHEERQPVAGQFAGKIPRLFHHHHAGDDDHEQVDQPANAHANVADPELRRFQHHVADGPEQQDQHHQLFIVIDQQHTQQQQGRQGRKAAELIPHAVAKRGNDCPDGQAENDQGQYGPGRDAEWLPQPVKHLR